MIPGPLIEIDTRLALPEALAEFGSFIKASAARLTDDRAQRKDLEQEAAITLWEIDPTRFDANDADYLRAVLYKRMQMAVRGERRARGGLKRVDIGGF